MFNNVRYQKEQNVLYGFLNGMKFNKSISAFNLAKQAHNGLRRDGSPEFSHQLSIALKLARNCKRLTNPDEVIALGLLHDSVEDSKIDISTIDKKCGEIVARGTELLSKKYFDTRRSDEEYMLRLALDINCSPVKGEDRIHNTSSMHNHGGMTLEKQKKYIKETEKLIIPMLRKARREFWEQSDYYIDQIRELETILKFSKIIIAQQDELRRIRNA